MKQTPTIEFSATLHRPAVSGNADWLFLRLPMEASEKLPARSMVSVEGTFDGTPFAATLEPDGEGGHWLRVERDLQESVGAKAGSVAHLSISPAAVEPEPKVPDDFRSALEAAPEKARETWSKTSAIARRDWIYWITTGKKAETRIKRIEVACSKLAAGNRRACCFDRSGMFDKSLSCPIAADDTKL